MVGSADWNNNQVLIVSLCIVYPYYLNFDGLN